MALNANVVLVGNLGGKPEIIQGKNKLFATFQLATTDSYKDSKDGEWKNKDTQWHDVIVFKDKLLEQVKDYDKGARIEVLGSLTYKTKVFFDESGKSLNVKQARIIAGTIKDASLSPKLP